jgi:hypothetical protein
MTTEAGEATFSRRLVKMANRTVVAIASVVVFGVVFFGAAGVGWAQGAKAPYPAMAPAEQYREASVTEEVALARSAANEAVSHWHPHLMFFLATTEAASWGADLKGSPVFSAQGDPEPVTTFMVPVMKWSYGTMEEMK